MEGFNGLGRLVWGTGIGIALLCQNLADAGMLRLPAPKTKGELSLEEARITEPRMGFRTVPSAGTIYPLEVYLVQKDGVYRYLPKTHSLSKTFEGDARRALFLAGLLQGPILKAPVSFVITAVYARTEAKYKDREERYVHLEAGHAAQNLLLQASAMGLGGVSIGAFVDSRVQRALGLPKDHTPLYIIPTGYPD
jgi:SagB-type dehydrogenase family enzyme